MFSKKCFSIFLSAVFLFSVVFADFAMAVPTPSDIVSNISLSDKPVDNSFGNYAQITSAADYGGDTVVLNVQDFHMHPEVQKNINLIIDTLVKKYGIENVFVEGAYGKVSTDWLSDMKNGYFAIEAIDKFLDSGAITGAEYYSAVNDRKDFLIGLEDEKIHKANIQRLGTLIEKQQYYNSAIVSLQKELDFFQEKYFSRKNKKLAKLVKQHKDGKISSDKYYTLLFNYLKKNSNQSYDTYGTIMPMDMSDYPNICLLLHSYKMQDSMNVKNINADLLKLVSTLKESMSFTEYKKLLEQTNNLQDMYQLVVFLGNMPQDFKDKHFSSGISKYIDVTNRVKQINPVDLIAEERFLVHEIRIALSANKNELEISFLSDFFLSFSDYLKTSISADNYAYFKGGFEKFQNMWSKYSFYNKTMYDLKGEFALLDEYYEVNDNRNEIFLMQIEKSASLKSGKQNKPVLNSNLTAMIKNKKNIIVCVTGGYHSKGLTDLLGDKKISFAVITPSISGSIDGTLASYEEAAAEQAKIFSQGLALSLFSQVVSYAISSNNLEAKRLAAKLFISAAQNLENIPFEDVNILIDSLNTAIGKDYMFTYNADTGDVDLSSNDGKYSEPFVEVRKNSEGKISIKNKYSSEEDDKVMLKSYRKMFTIDEMKKFMENFGKVLEINTLNFGTGVFLPKIYSSSVNIINWAAENNLFLDIKEINGPTFEMVERYGLDEKILNDNPEVAKYYKLWQDATVEKYLKLEDFTNGNMGEFERLIFATGLLNEFMPVSHDTLMIYDKYPAEMTSDEATTAESYNMTAEVFKIFFENTLAYRFLEAMKVQYEKSNRDSSVINRLWKQFEILREGSKLSSDGMTVQEIIDIFSGESALSQKESVLNEMKYGTAGYRAEFGERLNYVHILVNAQAIAEVAKERFAQAKKEGKLKGRDKAKVFVGYDTRFMSKEFAEVISSVLAANGMDVVLSDIDTPTPAISWLLGESKGEGYDLAVNITASHNPFVYNGIKVNEPFGGQAGSDITGAIQDKMNGISEGNIKIRYENLEKGFNSGNVEMKSGLMEEYVAAYIEMFKRQFNIKNEADFDTFKEKAKKFFFVADVKSGTTPKYYEEIMKALGISNYEIINDEFDPTFGGEDPNPDKNTALLKKRVEEIKKANPEAFVYGLATDPDGDRMAVIENGKTFTTDEIIIYNQYRLLEKAVQIAKETGKKQEVVIVPNLATTGALELVKEYFEKAYPELLDIKIVRTNIGFKWIAEVLKDAKESNPQVMTLGAEESGAVVVGGLTLDKDGLVATFGSASLAIDTGETIESTLQHIYSDEVLGWMPQKKMASVKFESMSDLSAKGAFLESIADDKTVQEAFIKQFEHLSETFKIERIEKIVGTSFEGIQIFTSNPKVLIILRLSGTEPLVKIYAESDSEKLTDDIIAVGNSILNNGIEVEKKKEEIQKEFSTAMKQTLDNSSEENIIRLINAAYAMATYETADKQEQEQMKKEAERAAVFFKYSSLLVVDNYKSDEHLYAKVQYLEKMYNDYFSREHKNMNLLTLIGSVYAIVYGYEFDKTALQQIGGFFNEHSSFTFDKNSGYIRSFLENIQNGDLKTIAQTLEDFYVSQGRSHEDAQSFIQRTIKMAFNVDLNDSKAVELFKEQAAAKNKKIKPSGSSGTLFSFALLPLMTAFPQIYEFLAISGDVWNTALAILIPTVAIFTLFNIIKLLKNDKSNSLTTLPSFKALKKHFNVISKKNIKELRSEDAPGADAQYRQELQGKNNRLIFDFSFNNVNAETFKLLFNFAKERGLKEFISDMMSGKKINTSENRAVLHTALRNVEKDKDGNIVSKGAIYVDGKDVMPDIVKVLEQMRDFDRKLENKELKGVTGKPIKTIISIGIGGSDLGPRMATAALERYKREGVEVRYVSNVDPRAAQLAMKDLDAETTMVIVESKTFTTQETIENAKTVRSELIKMLRTVDSSKSVEDIVSKHFIAVSTARGLVKDFGIDILSEEAAQVLNAKINEEINRRLTDPLNAKAIEEITREVRKEYTDGISDNIFEFWDFVGGRYSIWSAIGLPLVAAVGFDNYFEMLQGANAMDTHFAQADYEDNIPIRLAMIWVWYINFFKYDAHAIIPYSEDLRLFPKYAQQLYMESVGKSTDKDGNRITDYETGAAIFGESGTDSQHSFFQLFHQGTGIIPIDFITYMEPPALRENMTEEEKADVQRRHGIFLSNVFAQREAFAMGRSQEEVDAEVDAAMNKSIEEMNAKGASEGEIAYERERHEKLKLQKAFDGNRPTTLTTFDKQNPESLGMLIALYEHVTAVQAQIWNINAFDQWGVELGKVFAKGLQPAMEDGKEIGDAFSPTSQYHVESYKDSKKSGQAIMEENYPRVFSFLLGENSAFMTVLRIFFQEYRIAKNDPISFIRGHKSEDMAAAKTFIGAIMPSSNEMLKRSIIKGVTVISAMVAALVFISPSAPIIIVVAAFGVGFAELFIRFRHVKKYFSIDYQYVRNLKDDISRYSPKMSEKEMTAADHLEVIIINSMPENPKEMGFRNTGLKTSGAKTIWASKKTGRLVIFAQNSDFGDIALSVTDVIPAVLNKKGDVFEISAIAVDEKADLPKNINYFGDLLVIKRTYYDELLRLAGYDVKVAGERIRNAKEAGKNASARNFVMDLSHLESTDNVKEIIRTLSGYNKTDNSQIAVPYSFIEKLAAGQFEIESKGKQISNDNKNMRIENIKKQIVSEWSQSGLRVFASIDETAKDRHNLKAKFIEYGFVGYVERQDDKIITFRDYTSDSDSAVAEISGFNSRNELIRQIENSRHDAVKIVNVWNYAELITKDESDIASRIIELSNMFGRNIAGIFKKTINEQYVTDSVLDFNMNAIPNINEAVMNILHEKIANAERLKVSANLAKLNNSDGATIMLAEVKAHDALKEALAEFEKIPISRSIELNMLNMEIMENVHDGDIEKVQNAFFKAVAQKAKVKVDLYSNSPLGLEDKELERLFIKSALSHYDVDNNIIVKLENDLMVPMTREGEVISELDLSNQILMEGRTMVLAVDGTSSAMTAREAYDAVAIRAKELSLRDSVAAATIYEMILLYAERKTDTSVKEKSLAFDTKALTALLAAA